MGYGDKCGKWLAWGENFAHDSDDSAFGSCEAWRPVNATYSRTTSRKDLFSEDSATPEYRADPDTVRQELYKILAEARAAKTLPWDARRTALYRTIFPQMTNWLPEDEAVQLRFEFEVEMTRLKAA